MVIGMGVLAVAMVLGGLYSAYCAITGLWSGTFFCPFGNKCRRTHPIAFWLIFSGYCVVSVVLIVPVLESFS
jgi:hypothetical protein